jgi:hypothetical protein
MRQALLAGVVLATLACKPSESKEEAARATVVRFFEALPTGDCAVLGPLLAQGGDDAEVCAKTVRELNSHGYALVEVLDARVDGRDPEAVVVRTRIAQDGQVREQPFLVRVERHPKGWKLRL